MKYGNEDVKTTATGKTICNSSPHNAFVNLGWPWKWMCHLIRFSTDIYSVLGTLTTSFLSPPSLLQIFPLCSVCGNSGRTNARVASQMVSPHHPSFLEIQASLLGELAEAGMLKPCGG